jgi:hypothetical protein
MAYISGGLTEIQQVRAELEEIRAVVNELEPKLERMPLQLATFRQLEGVARRYLMLAQRMGLPEDVDNAIRFLSKLLIIMRQLQLTASLMALGPVGVLAAIPSVGLTVLSLASMSEGY